MPKGILGFTLVELMVTIAVASILLALAVPSFHNFTVSNRLTAQANDVIAGLHFARSEAIKRNRSILFCRAGSFTATTCETTAGAWRHWIVRTNAGEVVRRGDINTYGNSIVVSSTLTTDQVAFGSDGLARTGGVFVSDHRITVCATNGGTNNVRQVTMGRGSRLSIEVGSQACGT